jgi:hypothetical protein
MYFFANLFCYNMLSWHNAIYKKQGFFSMLQ